MRIKILLDIEMDDIPQAERIELEDIIGCQPTLMSEYTREEVVEALQVMFLSIDSYEAQQELWVGSNFHGMIKKIHAADPA